MITKRVSDNKSTFLLIWTSDFVRYSLFLSITHYIYLNSALEMNHTVKIHIRYFIMALALSLMVAPIRSGCFQVFGLSGLPLAMLIGSITFFLFTLICLTHTQTNTKPKYILLAIIIGVSFLELPTIIISFKDTLVSQPEFFSKYIVILFAYLHFITKQLYNKILITTSCFALILWMVFTGYDLWLNKLNYNSWTGKIEQTIDTRLAFQTQDEDTVYIEDYHGKYLILDFWISTCGACFKSFPAVEYLYKQYKDNPKVELIAIHCRSIKSQETYRTGSKKLQEIGYTFPCISVDENDLAMHETSINVFPIVLIFDPQSKLIFRGTIEGASKYIHDLVHDK